MRKAASELARLGEGERHVFVTIATGAREVNFTVGNRNLMHNSPKLHGAAASLVLEGGGGAHLSNRPAALLKGLARRARTEPGAQWHPEYEQHFF